MGNWLQNPVILDFSKTIEQKEFLILDGELAHAKETYIEIYNKATKSIIIIDNYIGIKTLRLLCNINNKNNAINSGNQIIQITIISDNIGNYLHQNDYEDFKKEYQNINIKFIKANNRIHDRFIVLDYGTNKENIYQCGTSTKDAGNKLTMIHKLSDNAIKEMMNKIIKDLLNNPELKLKK